MRRIRSVAVMASGLFYSLSPKKTLFSSKKHVIVSTDTLIRLPRHVHLSSKTRYYILSKT